MTDNMNSTTLLQLQASNNSAVSLIREGRHGDAIPLLLKTLMTAKAEIKKLAARPTEMTEGCCTGHQSMCSFVFVQMEVSSFETRAGCSIFSSPIEIVDASGRGCPDCYTQVSFCALFNIALCHHVVAMQCQDCRRRTPGLLRALGLYELASRMDLESLEDNSTAVIARVAILNNVFLIHSEFRNEELASACRQRLLESIMFLAASQDTKKLMLLGEAIISNVFHQDPCVAPAA